MDTNRLFKFNSPEVAFRLQEELSGLVQLTTDGPLPRLVCGLDAAYWDNSGVGVAAVVELDSGQVLETSFARRDDLVEYRSGLFGFREGPLLIEAVSNLKGRPEAFMVEGHGLAHPRRFGLACHIGVALDKPTVGIARELVYGVERDGRIVDRDGTILGGVLNVSGRRNPLYVSVGNRMDLESAISVSEKSLHSALYPVPLRAAHREAVKLKHGSFRS